VYADPGSGLFFVQVIAAVFLTVVFRLRRKLSKLIFRQGAKPLAEDTEN
jgi:hypothetical protein